MSEYDKEFALTPGEKGQARDYWEALMFAPTPLALDSARLSLIEAPASVQHAVMASITQMWLDEYEPRRDENPFKEEQPITYLESLETEPELQFEQMQEEMLQEHGARGSSESPLQAAHSYPTG